MSIISQLVCLKRVGEVPLEKRLILTYLNWALFHSRRLSQFKDKHKGEDCFIIGNGPSLNNMDLSHLKNFNTFGLNKIYLMFDRYDLNLSYHVSVNPLVIEQSKAEFENLKCPSFLSFRAAQEIVRPLCHIYYIITGGPLCFRTDLLREISEGATVTFVALQLAYYMGFQRVFLIGVDHNFKVSGSPNEKQYLDSMDDNHFDSQYFKNLEWHLPDLEASELAYRLAKFAFNRSGREIYDATDNGKLRVFPKISYNRVLKLSRKKIKTF